MNSLTHLLYFNQGQAPQPEGNKSKNKRVHVDDASAMQESTSAAAVSEETDEVKRPKEGMLLSVHWMYKH